MIYILGGWQSDFADNWTRKGWDTAAAFAEAVGAGLDAVDLEPGDIECGHVGNFAGELFAGQGLLGGFFALAHPDFNGMPTARHEAACASGSVAMLAAGAEIRAGRYDLAYVLGFEQMRNVSGEQAARHLGAPTNMRSATASTFATSWRSAKTISITPLVDCRQPAGSLKTGPRSPARSVGAHRERPSLSADGVARNF
jgi:acetyl-CoA acetyltransferase